MKTRTETERHVAASEAVGPRTVVTGHDSAVSFQAVVGQITVPPGALAALAVVGSPMDPDQPC